MKQPKIYVFAGPNGAGKSTLTERILKNKQMIINPDVIAKEEG